MGQHDDFELSEQAQTMLDISDSMTELRETINVMVQALAVDGFTDREAREIITSFYRGMWPNVSPHGGI